MLLGSILAIIEKKVLQKLNSVDVTKVCGGESSLAGRCSLKPGLYVPGDVELFKIIAYSRNAENRDPAHGRLRSFAEVWGGIP